MAEQDSSQTDGPTPREDTVGGLDEAGMDEVRDQGIADGVDVTVLIGTFDALPDRADALAGILARYVVMTRRRPTCTNVDLVVSVLEPGRFTIIEKWRSAEDQRAHMDAPETVAFAEDCRGLLGAAPRFDLCDGISAHDLV